MPFAEFWAAYPRHDAKKDAQKAWAKLNPSPELEQRILTALAWQIDKEQWENEQYIPLPASWLRGERWTDERKVNRREGERRRQQSPQGILYQCPHTPSCENRWTCGQKQLRERQAS